MNEDFKDRLNQALKETGMSAAELSRLSGVNEGAISQYRKGKYKASQDNLDRIASVLNVPIPWLMGLDQVCPFKKRITEQEQRILDKIRQLDDLTMLENYIDFLIMQSGKNNIESQEG